MPDTPDISRCDHCGAPEPFGVLCAECEQLVCTDCGRVECCCKPGLGQLDLDYGDQQPTNRDVPRSDAPTDAATRREGSG